MHRPRLDPLRLSIVASVAAFFVPLYACGGGGEEGEGGGASLPVTASAARGALLYDRWWAELGAPLPSTSPVAHAVAPDALADGTTWRCAECHGWDYKGSTGAGATTHSARARRALVDAKAAPQALFDAIRGIGTTHDFSTKLGTADVWDLVAFVTTGASDTTPSIESTGVARGDARAGASGFAANCATCHGDDGKAIDLGDGRGVGELATCDPWHVLHQIRWGVAGTTMPSMEAEGLSTAAQADILAYAQTLAGDAPPPPPSPPPAATTTTTFSYAKDIHPIWKARGCTGCHRGSGGLTLSCGPCESHAQLFATASRVDRSTPSQSLILRKPSMSGVAHGGGRIFSNPSDADYRRILAWINQGGPNN